MNARRNTTLSSLIGTNKLSNLLKMFLVEVNKHLEKSLTKSLTNKRMQPKLKFTTIYIENDQKYFQG